MSKYTYYEVCIHPYTENDEGTTYAKTLEETAGWSVYVRGYASIEDADWEAVHDQDFPIQYFGVNTEKLAIMQAQEWADAYKCGIDSY